MSEGTENNITHIQSTEKGFKRQLERVGRDRDEHSIKVGLKAAGLFNLALGKEKFEDIRVNNQTRLHPNEEKRLALVRAFSNLTADETNSQSTTVRMRGELLPFALQFIQVYIPREIDAPPPYSLKKMENPTYIASKNLIERMIWDYFRSPRVESSEKPHQGLIRKVVERVGFIRR